MIRFFQKIIDVLNEYRIQYMLSGSVAMSLYVLPRATRDFDFVIHLLPQDVESFVSKFKEGYLQDLQSGIQQEDIKNLSAIPELDWDYVNDWISRLKLNTFELFPK